VARPISYLVGLSYVDALLHCSVWLAPFAMLCCEPRERDRREKEEGLTGTDCGSVLGSEPEILAKERWRRPGATGGHELTYSEMGSMTVNVTRGMVGKEEAMLPARDGNNAPGQGTKCGVSSSTLRTEYAARSRSLKGTQVAWKRAGGATDGSCARLAQLTGRYIRC
jgi:hypothetical protein